MYPQLVTRNKVPPVWPYLFNILYFGLIFCFVPVELLVDYFILFQLVISNLLYFKCNHSHTDERTLDFLHLLWAIVFSVSKRNNDKNEQAVWCLRLMHKALLLAPNGDVQRFMARIAVHCILVYKVCGTFVKIRQTTNSDVFSSFITKPPWICPGNDCWCLLSNGRWTLVFLVKVYPPLKPLIHPCLYFLTIYCISHYIVSSTNQLFFRAKRAWTLLICMWSWHVTGHMFYDTFLCALKKHKTMLIWCWRLWVEDDGGLGDKSLGEKQETSFPQWQS